jgi:hypothetical protein
MMRCCNPVIPDQRSDDQWKWPEAEPATERWGLCNGQEPLALAFPDALTDSIGYGIVEADECWTAKLFRPETHQIFTVW